MSRPAINSIELTETLTLSECHPTADHRGAWWLYDETRGMNLAIGEKTQTDAFVEALTYYQNRLGDVERAYKCLKNTVDAFVAQVVDEDDV